MRTSAFKPLYVAITLSLATMAAAQVQNGGDGAHGATPVTAQAKPVVPETSAKPPLGSDQAKDVVLDQPAAAPPRAGEPGGRIVRAPDAAPAPTPTSTVPAVVRTAAALGHDARVEQFAAGLGDVGLALLRGDGGLGGNALVSPFSIGNALGMAHAGAVGHTRDQISGLFEPRSAQGRVFAHGAQVLTAALATNVPGVELYSANRIWVSKSIAPQLAAPYISTLRSAYGADGVAVDFAQAEPVRAEINGWIADGTKGQIKNLLPGGAIKPNTKAVLTNAVYFRGKWQSPFDAAQTADRAFKLDGGHRVMVPTMSGDVSLREGQIDGLTVYELGYAGSQYAMLIALAPEGHTLQALETDTAGADIAGWSKRLGPTVRATVQLPKFRIAPVTVALNDRLKALGMVAAFDQGANFTGITGKANDLQIDQVFHAAGIVVDEAGSEATAATAAVMTAKSIVIPAQRTRIIDRPFVFAVIHKPTGAPLFVGKIANPAAANG